MDRASGYVQPTANKDQNNLLEEAAQDLIKKYEQKVSTLNLKPFPNAYCDDSSQIEMFG